MKLKKQNSDYKSSSLWLESFKQLKKNKFAMGGLFFIIFMLLLCFIGPLFSPYAKGIVDVTAMQKPPSSLHWLGTDKLGRDVLTRLMQAGQISLTIGIASMFLSLLLGAIIGSVSGYYGGVVDTIFMRLADILMSIPSLPLLMIIAAILNEMKVPGQFRIYVVMIMLSLVGWPSLARLIRGQVLSLREQPFMMAADVLGLTDFRKIVYHLIPNVMPILIVVATLNIAGAILNESVLSYLGVGVIPPTPSWGNMISAANNLIDFQKRPWLWVTPGMAIFLTVISINLLGDGLRDVLDPKQKGR